MQPNAIRIPSLPREAPWHPTRFTECLVRAEIRVALPVDLEDFGIKGCDHGFIVEGKRRQNDAQRLCPLPEHELFSEAGCSDAQENRSLGREIQRELAFLVCRRELLH